MKKIILLIVTLLLLTGCEVVEIEENTVEANSQVEMQKPLTKQVCDWLGINSSSIIEEQAQQGYTFTGRTTGIWCENLLNFQLKEDK